MCSLTDLILSSAFSLGFLRAHGPESTNLPGTARSPARQQPLAWAQRFPEGTGGQWLSGSRGDRSSPGGTGWGCRLWDLGDNGRVSRAGSDSGCPGSETALGQPTVKMLYSNFWACWPGGAPPWLTTGQPDVRCVLRKLLWAPEILSSGCGSCPHWSHESHHPWVCSVACRPHCSGLSAGPVEMTKVMVGVQQVPCAWGRLTQATAKVPVP